MRMSIGMSVLPLLCTAGFAMAQEVAPPPGPAAAPAAVQEQARVREQDAARTTVRRQGADMRHCLKLKDSRAIIRCAEPGRKP